MVQERISFPDIQGQDIICDLDGTLIEGDIGESTFFHLLLKDYIVGNTFQESVFLPANEDTAPGVEIVTKYLEYCKSNQFDLAYKYTAEIIDKYPQHEISQVVTELLNNNSGRRDIQLELPSSTNNKYKTSYDVAIRKRFMAILNHFQDQGALLWIVSASPQHVVDACGAAFHFPAGNVYGSIPKSETNNQGRFPWKSGKVKILQEAGVLDPLIVVGDGLGDLEMLKIARYPIVMEDGHPDLVTYAKEQGWFLYNNNSEIILNGKSL